MKQKGKSRFLSALLAVIMVMTMLPGTALAAKTVNNDDYVAGTYTGTGYGHDNGKVTVTLTLAEDSEGQMKITDISADGSTQTPSFWSNAVTILDTIKENNGTEGVDTVSKATQSSKAIIDATEDALAKASAVIDGTGTQSDPYVITSENGLRALQAQVKAGNTYAGEYIKLANDIELTKEWTPIGSSKDEAFGGTFDGNGHTISGMTVTESSLGYVGLFGYTLNGVVIKNLRLEDISIDMPEAAQNVYAAGLVGFIKNNTSGTISSVIDNCYVSGNITVNNADKITVVGGLSAFTDQRAAVTNCGTDVDIDVNSGTGRTTVGGLVAWASVRALFMNDYVLGNVTVATDNEDFDNVGVMFGQVNGIIYNCYAAGSIKLTASEGVALPTPAGLFAGNLAAATYADSCYYLADGEKSAFGTFTGSYNAETVIGKTADELASDDLAGLLHDNLSSSALETMTANVTEANVSGCGDFGAMTGRVGNNFYDWEVSGNKVVLADMLWTSGKIDDSIFESGDGTEEEPYIIKTEKQLRDFAGSLNNKIDYTNQYVALGDDIVLSSEEWKPIGRSDYLFNGTFDGQGHTISGMTLGTADEAFALDSENVYIGLFGVLGPKAYVKDVHLTGVSFHVSYGASITIGGIAGGMQGATGKSDYTGAVIDGCSVKGVISATGEQGNQFVGGLVGQQFKGAIINSSTDVELSGIVTSEALAEVGGLVGLNNRGLVANCWSDSNVYGSGSRENGDEGMAVVSNLIACNAGAEVNCYATGDTTTKEHSTYAGMVSGWVTGIGKTYTCWYDLNNTMIVGKDTNNPLYVNPVESIGTKVASGVNDEGDAYTGGLVDKMVGCNADGDSDKNIIAYAAVADAINKNFETFPIDITAFGLKETALKNWTYENEQITFGTDHGTVNYVKPDCETVVKPEQKLQDGKWYGRDNDKKSVIEIVVENNEIVKTTVVSGEKEGTAAYEAALEKAKSKATYGDFSHYEKADTARFAGGSGTYSDPYQIANEEQLRYLAYSINSDVSWSGVHFKQTADITLNGEWLPIGWVLNAEVNGKKTTVAAYPFRGNYDGGNFTITGLTIGTAEQPKDQVASGLFGFTDGAYANIGNAKPFGSEQVVRLSNIHLKDIRINVKTRYETFTGGLVGNGQNGIYIDNCSVTGTINAETTESFARAGGLSAYLLRGAVTNSWTDVDVNAVTDSNHVYAGGFYGMDNRVTTLNCYALGDVTGNSTNNNKVHIGGFAGQAGGVHVNCYAAGDVVSLKSTTDVGIISGRSSGINIDYHVYYNTEATLRQGATTEAAKAVGVVTTNAVKKDVTGKTAAELKTKAFAGQLNANIAKAALDADISEIDAKLANPGSGLSQANYYLGNGLSSWTVKDGVVTFGKVEDGGNENPGSDGDNSGSGSGSSGSSISGSNNSVTAPSTSGGSVTVSTKNASAGSKVTITVKPESGYVLGGLTVTDANGNQLKLTDNGDGTYTFTMPSSKVTVNADFEKAGSFSDVASGAYCFDAVEWAVKNGVTNGLTDTTFGPSEACTRAQIVTFLWRAAGSPAPVSGENPFSDVSSEAYYYNAVLWAVEQGITTGTSDTTFSPDATCTRAQAVSFIWRAAGKRQGAAASDFADVTSGEYYEGAVNWAVEKGVTNGVSETSFAPASPCTRGQIVTFIYRWAAK